MAHVADPDRFRRAFQALGSLAQETARLRETLDATLALELKSTWFPERRDNERRVDDERRTGDRRRPGASERRAF
jgi:hypothetical protein